MASLGLLDAYASDSESEGDGEAGEGASRGRKEEGAQEASPPPQQQQQEKEEDEGRSSPGVRREGDEQAGGATTSDDALTPCDPAVQAKVAKFLQLKQMQGRDLIEDIRSRKSFRNPDFLQKMVEHFQIEPYASSYPKRLWDASDVAEEDTYLRLEAQLERVEELRRQEQRRRQEVDARGAIQFQRAGFRSNATHQPKRKRRYFE